MYKRPISRSKQKIRTSRYYHRIIRLNFLRLTPHCPLPTIPTAQKKDSSTKAIVEEL